MRTVKQAMHAPLLRPGWLSDLPRDPEFNAHAARPARQVAQVAGDEPGQSGQDNASLRVGAANVSDAADRQRAAAAAGDDVQPNTPSDALPEASSGSQQDGLAGGPETQAVEAAERADVTTPEEAQHGEARLSQEQPAAPRPNTWSSMRKLPNLHETLNWQ